MLAEVDTELEDYLQELFELEGVIGAFISTNSADLMVSKMPSVYDESAINGLSKKLSRILASAKDLKMKQESLIFSFDAGMVILKDLRRGYLVILSSFEEVNPLMDISINMVKKKLVRYLSFGTKTSQTKVEVSEEVEPVDLEEDLNFVDANKIKELNKEFCKYLGPAGGMIIKKKAKKLGYEWNSVPQSELSNFLKNLEQMIESDKDALSFNAFCQEIF